VHVGAVCRTAVTGTLSYRSDVAGRWTKLQAPRTRARGSAA
jgi:hypothetical protein